MLSSFFCRRETSGKRKRASCTEVRSVGGSSSSVVRAAGTKAGLEVSNEFTLALGQPQNKQPEAAAAATAAKCSAQKTFVDRRSEIVDVEILSQTKQTKQKGKHTHENPNYENVRKTSIKINALRETGRESTYARAKSRAYIKRKKKNNQKTTL